MKTPPNVFKIISVDFDKTICNSDYPKIISPKENVKESLQKLRDMGFWIIISSCRTCKFYPEIFNTSNEILDMNRTVVIDMIKFLDDNKIPYDDIDDGLHGKVFAEYYIDDKGIRYNDNWLEIVKFIEKEQ